MDPTQQAQAFLSTIFPDLGDRYLVIWRASNRESTFCKKTDEAARAAIQYDLDDGNNVYYGCGLLDKELDKRRRGHEEDMKAIGALWFDLDLKSKENPNRPRNLAEARNIWMPIGEEPGSFEPSIIVSSGNGLHVYWLLDRILDDVERATAILKRWSHTLKAWGPFHGWDWKFDSVDQLSRPMRIPGTHNWKDPENVLPVEVLEQNGRRFAVEELEDAALPLPKWAEEGNIGGGSWPEISIDLNRRLTEDELAAYRQFDATLYDAIHGRVGDNLRKTRGGEIDASSLDASIARRVYDMGKGDQDAADAIIHCRATLGFDMKKLLRPDYIPRTLAKVKESSARDREALKFEPPPAVTTTNVPAPAEPVREDSLAYVRDRLGLPITAFRMIGTGESARCELLMEDGRMVTVGKMESLYSQAKLHCAIASHGMVPPPRLKTNQWHQVIQRLMMAVEHVEIEEQGVVEETGRWMRAYLQARASGNRQGIARGDKALEQTQYSGIPAIQDGRLYLQADRFLTYIRRECDSRVEIGDLHARLRAMGFVYEQIAAKCWAWYRAVDEIIEYIPEQERQDAEKGQ
jgi:hypothetical protein